MFSTLVQSVWLYCVAIAHYTVFKELISVLYANYEYSAYVVAPSAQLSSISILISQSIHSHSERFYPFNKYETRN
jgi:hypothetical protein